MMVELNDIWEPEELHPDLRDHVRDGPVGQMLHHPLLINVLILPGRHRMDNQAYVHRKADVERAWAEGNWSRYVFRHERPYRSEALQRVIGDPRAPMESEHTWSLVKKVWTDSENVQEHNAFWAALWTNARPELTFTANEAKALAKCPKSIPIWHGLERRDKKELGYSWTMDKSVAEWFAQRFAGFNERGAYIASGTIDKDRVKAYLLDRGESEIIAFPGDVENVVIRATSSSGRRSSRGWT